MEYNFCNIANKYLCKYADTKTSIKNNAVESKYNNI